MEIYSTSRSKIDFGTVKYLLKLQSGELIESVFLPFKRGEICVSSQVGCIVNCLFCSTGKAGFVRNLSTKEIVDQVVLIKKDLSIEVNSVTFMGMGEPLLNYSNVKAAINQIRKNLKVKRIRLATVGIVPKMYELADDQLDVELFVSLHASNDKQRQKIIPNNKYKISEIFEALDYISKKDSKMMNIYYNLINGFNNNDSDITRLTELIGNRPIVIYLKKICGKHKEFKKASILDLQKFRKKLDKNNIASFIMVSSGEDIAAGCGQLKHKIESENTNKMLR